MAATGFLLIASFMLVLLLLAKPLGNFIAQLIEGQPGAFLQRVENGVLRTSGSSDAEMNWWQYALAIMGVQHSGDYRADGHADGSGRVADEPAAFWRIVVGSGV
jgi:hypothetical protein